MKLTDDFARLSFQNPDDAALFSFLPDRLDSCDDTISMHRLFQISGADENVLFSFCFRDDEPIPVRMRFDPAHDQIHLRRKTVTVPSNPNHPSLFRQISEEFPRLLPLFFPET